MGKKDKRKRVLPPLTFESLVLPFYSQALVALGRLPDGREDKGGKVDLELAARLIDLIDLLAEKTKGNLTKEEEEFLQMVSAELKIIFYRAAGKGEEGAN